MSFADKLKKYGAQSAAPTTAPQAAVEPEPVKVNPPEAVQVMAQQTLPETQGVPEPKEPEPEKKTRGKGKKEPTSAAVAAEALAQAGRDDLATLILAVSEKLPKGTHITITSAAG